MKHKLYVCTKTLMLDGGETLDASEKHKYLLLFFYRKRTASDFMLLGFVAMAMTCSMTIVTPILNFVES